MDSVLYKSTRLLLMATALIQLAISQIHIEMITQLFVTSIGFYLFLFIITGLLILFNLTSMSQSAGGRLGMYIATTVGALVSGGVYIMKVLGDYQVQESVTLETIQLSVAFSIAAMAIYLVGGIIVTTKCLKEEEA